MLSCELRWQSCLQLLSSARSSRSVQLSSGSRKQMQTLQHCRAGCGMQRQQPTPLPLQPTLIWQPRCAACTLQPEVHRPIGKPDALPQKTPSRMCRAHQQQWSCSKQQTHVQLLPRQQLQRHLLSRASHGRPGSWRRRRAEQRRCSSLSSSCCSGQLLSALRQQSTLHSCR